MKLRSQDGPGTWRGVEADGIVVLPGSMIWKNGRFERNGCGAAIPGAQLGNNIHDPAQRSGSW